MFGSFLVPSTKEIDRLTRESLTQTRPTEELMTVVATMAEESITTQTRQTAPPGSEKVRADFFQLYESLNTMTAKAPSYMEACAKLGLDPVNPLLPGCTMDTKPEPHFFKSH